MALLNDVVSVLHGIGADAMSNMYDVLISFPTGLSPELTQDQSQNIKVRCQGFTPPEPKITIYDVDYKTVKIKRPATKVEYDRSFTLTFRLDAKYDLLNKFKVWRNKIVNPISGFATNMLDNDTMLGSLTITAYAGDFKEIAGDGTEGIISDNKLTTTPKYWQYAGVWIESVKDPEFKLADAAPATFDVKFQFLQLQGEGLTPPATV